MNTSLCNPKVINITIEISFSGLKIKHAHTHTNMSEPLAHITLRVSRSWAKVPQDTTLLLVKKETDLRRVAGPSWPRSWGRGDPDARCGPSHTGLARWPHTGCARSCRRLETDRKERWVEFIWRGKHLSLLLVLLLHAFEGESCQ